MTLTTTLDGRNGTSAPWETLTLGLTDSACGAVTTLGSLTSWATTSPLRAGVNVSV